MFRIENIGNNCLLIKALGTFPKSVAKRFISEFEEKTKNLENFSVIVDGTDFILLRLESVEMILDLLKKNNEKLIKSAFIISKNPPLNKEAQILLERADSPKRKIVATLDEAKKWLGISDIIIQKD